jgi:hypothetical protein
MAILTVGWIAIGLGTASARRPACAGGVFPVDTGSTLTIDETTSPPTVLFTGCEAGTGKLKAGRKATRVIATFPSCSGLGRSTRARLRATIPFPSCSGARTKLIFAKGKMSRPAVPPRTPGGYAATVRPLLNASCASSAGCHGGRTPQQNLDLSSANSYDAIVNQPSLQEPSLLLVKPGDPAHSYLLRKVEGAPGIVGVPMPFTGKRLSPDQIKSLSDWIAAGAPND